MGALYSLLAALLGGAVGRVLTGAGMAVISYSAMAPLVLGALNLAMGFFDGAPAKMAAVVAMSGAGEAFSMLGSALLTRVAIASMTSSVGKAAAVVAG